MAARHVLTRLLRLRELEEEQSRLDLEFKVVERDRIVRQLAVAECRRTAGREHLAAGIIQNSATQRTGGMMEMEQAKIQKQRIESVLNAAESAVAGQRETFLAYRTGRRQVETLVENMRDMDSVEASRRAQRMLDDWYGRRTAKEKTVRRSSAKACAEEKAVAWSDNQPSAP